MVDVVTIGDSVTLYHGDCLEILPTLAAGSIDAVVTDPPYCSGGYLEAQKNTKAQGLRGTTVMADDFRWFRNDNMTTSGLVWLLRSLMLGSLRILRQNRSAFVFTDWRMVPHVAPALESAQMRYRNMIIWDKGNGGLGIGFKPTYEVILEFTNGVTEYQALDGSNILRVSRVHSSQREHKTQKPIELISEIIRIAVPVGGTVLDCFLGSGTTGVACVQTGRQFIGIEIDRGYFDIACRRIEAAMAQMRLPLEI